MKSTDELVAECVRAIDAANAEDPTKLEFKGTLHPQALLEGERAQAWAEKLRSDARPALRLAARAHHIRRWEVPRASFPQDRTGYHAWRTHLYGFHGDALAQIMGKSGFASDEVDRARVILQKKGIKKDRDVQAHEDAVSLAFLEVRLSDFIPTVSNEQLLRAIRRTWAKMSVEGQHEARTLVLAEPAAEAIQAALE